MIPVPLKAALIGCGRIGARTEDRLRQSLAPYWFPYSHADALQEVQEARLAAVCDVSLERAQETAAAYGAEAAFDDAAALLETVQPDLLMVATRTEGRAEIIRLAAEKGVRGIHFEKPLGRSMAECRSAMSAAERAGTLLSYGAVRRCMDAFRRAKEALEEGRIGPLRHILVETRKSELLWALPHSLDLITFYAGVPESATVQADLEIPPGSFDGQTLDADPFVLGAQMQFSNRIRVTLATSGNSWIKLTGEKGELMVPLHGGWLCHQEQHGTPLAPLPPVLASLPVDNAVSGRLASLRALSRAVFGQEPPPHTAAEILFANALGLGMAWSALHGGKTVSLEELPEDFTVTGRKGELYA